PGPVGVDVGRSAGASLHPACVGAPCTGSLVPSLPQTITRLATPLADASKRTCQKAALAPKKARFTPASRAASAASRICLDQYSSCPTERNPLQFSSRLPLAWVSTLVE